MFSVLIKNSRVNFNEKGCLKGFHLDIVVCRRFPIIKHALDNVHVRFYDSCGQCAQFMGKFSRSMAKVASLYFNAGKSIPSFRIDQRVSAKE